jgi:hypothetical protein
MTVQIREVRLPAELCTAAEEHYRKQFGSLEELIVFVLGELTREDITQLDLCEQKLVEERLRQLGYL